MFFRPPGKNDNICQIKKNQQDGNNINSTATEICSCVINLTELNQKDYSNYIGRQAKDPVCVCMIDHQPSNHMTNWQAIMHN